MRKLSFFLVSLFLIVSAWAESNIEETGLFSGRISRVNTKASLLRVKIDFPNMKYINKKDKVSFWNEHNPAQRCRGYVIGKSTKYMLLKIPEFHLCEYLMFVSPGAHLFFFSQDLINNLKMGREVVGILNKKRLALRGHLETHKKDLEIHLEKIGALNDRYEILRKKLEAERKKELSLIEEDRLAVLKKYKKVQIRLNSVDQKLEKYRIEDENLEIDRWALDSKLYYKK